MVYRRINSITKKTPDAKLPNVEEASVVNQSSSPSHGFSAIALSGHHPEQKILYAVLASWLSREDLRRHYKVDASRLGPRLQINDMVHICVPLKESSTHLSLVDDTLCCFLLIMS